MITFRLRFWLIFFFQSGLLLMFCFQFCFLFFSLSPSYYISFVKCLRFYNRPFIIQNSFFLYINFLLKKEFRFCRCGCCCWIRIESVNELVTRWRQLWDEIDSYLQEFLIAFRRWFPSLLLPPLRFNPIHSERNRNRRWVEDVDEHAAAPSPTRWLSNLILMDWFNGWLQLGKGGGDYTVPCHYLSFYRMRFFDWWRCRADQGVSTASFSMMMLTWWWLFVCFCFVFVFVAHCRWKTARWTSTVPSCRRWNASRSGWSKSWRRCTIRHRNCAKWSARTRSSNTPPWSNAKLWQPSGRHQDRRSPSLLDEMTAGWEKGRKGGGGVQAKATVKTADTTKSSSIFFVTVTYIDSHLNRWHDAGTAEMITFIHLFRS